MKELRSTYQKIISLIFPIRCVGCGTWHEWLCQDCIQNIKPVNTLICLYCQKPAIGGMTHPRCKTPRALDAVLALGNYTGILKKAIIELKFKGHQPLANILGELLTTELLVQNYWTPSHTLIIPMPIHSKRLKERGFNQTELIAKTVAETLRIGLNSEALIRKTYRRPQVGLSKYDRVQNVKNTFTCQDRAAIKNRSLILLDDVCTTGATLKEAAKTLMAAGAKQVFGLVLALDNRCDNKPFLL